MLCRGMTRIGRSDPAEHEDGASERRKSRSAINLRSVLNKGHSNLLHVSDMALVTVQRSSRPGLNGVRYPAGIPTAYESETAVAAAMQ